jgi:histidinol-phosphatase
LPPAQRGKYYFVINHRSALPAPQISEIKGFAEQLTDAAKAAKHSFSMKNAKLRHKPVTDEPVTDLDIRIENEWRSSIQRFLPNQSIVGEETGNYSGDGQFTWLLDPIDGTDDLTRSIPLYSSIITALYMGEPIVGIIDHPALDLRCQASCRGGVYTDGNPLNLKNQSADNLTDAIAIPAYADFQPQDDGDTLLLALARAFPNLRIYRNVYAHTLAISGMITAALELNVSSWDLAAIKLIIEEAEGDFVLFQHAGTDYARKEYSAVFGRNDAVSTISAIIQQ